MKVDISSILIGKDSEIKIFGEIMYSPECELCMDINHNVDKSTVDILITDSQSHAKFGLLNVNDIKINLDGRIFIQNEAIFVELNYKTNMTVSCSRCLEPTKATSESHLYDMICDKKGQAYEEMEHLFDGRFFLLTCYLVDDLIVNESPQVLCLEDCEGLCHKCGTNLNYEECTCERESFDPRLSALKDFFTDKGGVENGSTKAKNFKS